MWFDTTQFHTSLFTFQSNCAEGLHFSAFHFVGVSDSKESLQKLIDVVYSYCSKWRLRANVIKSAVMVFSKDAVNGCWKWGEYSLPKVSSYSYLGIDFSSNGAWDMHIKKLLDNGRKKVNLLHKVISNRNVNLSSCRLCYCL